MRKKLTLIFKEDSGCYQSRSYGSVSSAWPWPLRELYNAGREYCWIQKDQKTLTIVKPICRKGNSTATLKKTEFLIQENQLDLSALELLLLYGANNTALNPAL